MRPSAPRRGVAYTIRFNNNELTFMPIFFYCT
eukprot:COSAG05_NODE_23835_length_255_cov_0.852564_1_plen_31_part_01